MSYSRSQNITEIDIKYVVYLPTVIRELIFDLCEDDLSYLDTRVIKNRNCHAIFYSLKHHIDRCQSDGFMKDIVEYITYMINTTQDILRIVKYFAYSYISYEEIYNLLRKEITLKNMVSLCNTHRHYVNCLNARMSGDCATQMSLYSGEDCVFGLQLSDPLNYDGEMYGVCGCRIIGWEQHPIPDDFDIDSDDICGEYFYRY